MNITDMRRLNLTQLNQQNNRPEQQAEQVKKQFTALLWQQVLKGMRNTTKLNNQQDNGVCDLYFDMFDEKIANMLTDCNCLKLSAKSTAPTATDDSINSANISHKISSRYDDQHNNKKHAFISNLSPYIKKAAHKLGINPEYLMAQAALETNWGTKMIGNNLFGIKQHNWQGKSHQTLTHEVHAGKWHAEQANFRSYANWQHACDDYVHFLQNNPRYQKALQNTDNGEKFIRELQNAGYASDPNYANKISQIAYQINNIHQTTK